MSETEQTGDRIDLLVSEMSGTRRWTNWTSNLVLVIGLLFMGLLCAYFGYFYYTFEQITRPDRMVAALRGYVEEMTPEARRMASTEIRNSAPVWAREVSHEVMTRVPVWREQIETGITSVVDEQLKQAHATTSSEFERVVQDNRQQLKEAIDQITSDGNTDEFVDSVLPIFEKEYIPDLKYDAIQILGVLDDINLKFQKLAAGDELNPVEEQMRYILGLTRYIRETEVPGAFDPGETDQ